MQALWHRIGQASLSCNYRDFFPDGEESFAQMREILSEEGTLFLTQRNMCSL